MKIVNKLSPKDWALHDLMMETINSPNSFFTVQQICERLPQYFKTGKSNCEGSNTNCPSLYDSINKINASTESDKIIVMNNNKFYFATEEEAADYANKLRIRALKAWKKYHDINQKISKDGQGKLISNHGDVITIKSKARMFVESYVSHELEGATDGD